MDTHCSSFPWMGQWLRFILEKELGQRLTDAVLDELKTNRYGDISG